MAGPSGPFHRGLFRAHTRCSSISGSDSLVVLVHPGVDELSTLSISSCVQDIGDSMACEPMHRDLDTHEQLLSDLSKHPCDREAYHFD